MISREQRPEATAEWARAADLVMSVTARAFSVPKDSLLRKSRCEQDVAFARQVAMYLLHITFGGTYKTAGEAIGRERTTIAYACSKIEDRRDDAEFDRKMEGLEARLEKLWDIEYPRAARRAAALAAA